MEAIGASGEKRSRSPEQTSRAQEGEASVSQFEDHVKSSCLHAFTFDYFVLGVVEEAGEVATAASKSKPGSHCARVAQELGDLLWYATAVRVSLEDEPLASWPVAADGEAESKTDRMFTRPVDLVVLASKLAGRTKKAIRGDMALDAFLPDLRMYVRQVLGCCADVASGHGLTLSQCALSNMRKLEDRRRRGTIRGEGDDR